MKYYDTTQHVAGKSQFIDDITVPEGTLYAAIFYSPIAKGKIIKLNIEEAKNYSGVKAVFTHQDIEGANQIGGIVQDEELLASHEVDFVGQPIAIVVANDYLTAKNAAKKNQIEIEEETPILDPREAQRKGELIVQPMIFELGSTETVWDECNIIVEGIAESGAQEHLYLETQGAIAIPTEGGGLKIISSTQSPTAVQRVTANVLNMPMHKIEVDVMRLGGGFGGKEDQATPYAAMVGLAAHKLGKPVKMVLPRQEDMRITGKRHPYSSDFKIGLSKDLKILAYEASYYQNAGAAADLSPAVLQRTMTHATNSYFIPNVKATGYSCRTNLPPFTAFRGFGGPQGMFVIESAIHSAAKKLGVDPFEIQKKNLLRSGDEFPYSQIVEHGNAVKCWKHLEEKINLNEIKNGIAEFNSKSKFIKKGFALMPICFGISFTSKFMNQAGALVNIYQDGSIGISTAAIEMGQGVNTKIRNVAEKIFSIDISKIKIETTNTTRIPNTSPTAASSGADLNGKATELACVKLFDRLIDFAKNELRCREDSKIEIVNENIIVDGVQSELNWNELIQRAYFNRINLSAQAHFATPEIHFDTKKNKGKPFAYHSYGTGLIEVSVDCLRGTYEIDSVQVVHDFGKSINKVIDKGQAEGAIIQGIAWMTIEEILYDEKGKLMTDALSTYKIPGIHFTPKEFDVKFLENTENPFAVFGSKAIGEPPLMYGIAAYFAIRNAMESFNPNMNAEYKAPMTNERVLMALFNRNL
ncbi:MAG: molybdopterin-dependent oxidoreductase [Ignavibacteriae bacterium]|nr:xanthine dehydrogenase [Ignavibacteriota bacterium]NOG96480.1 molybdopterin-dependent oxidoreductase [Ignavibacteriota bacterium]